MIKRILLTAFLTAYCIAIPGYAQTDSAYPASLRIEGAVLNAGDADHMVVDLEMLQTMPPHHIYTSTVVTDGVIRFDGVLMRALLERVGAYGRVVTATGLNGYQVDIPVQDFVDFDVVLAWAMDGERLRPDDKGPFWIVYPRDQHIQLQDIRYDYRWVWQLISLQVN